MDSKFNSISESDRKIIELAVYDLVINSGSWLTNSEPDEYTEIPVVAARLGKKKLSDLENDYLHYIWEKEVEYKREVAEENGIDFDNL